MQLATPSPTEPAPPCPRAITVSRSTPRAGDVIEIDFQRDLYTPVLTDVKISDVKHACDGKITFTPTGHRGFPRSRRSRNHHVLL